MHEYPVVASDSLSQLPPQQQLVSRRVVYGYSNLFFFLFKGNAAGRSVLYSLRAYVLYLYTRLRIHPLTESLSDLTVSYFLCSQIVFLEQTLSLSHS